MHLYQLADLRPKSTPYFEFVRTSDLSAGVYRLSAGAEDTQDPHTEDEIYYVVSGRAHFSAGDQNVPVSPGDILFVAANEQHRFSDIQQDLELLVFFAPAEGSR
jgi:mannose-6-phosphate isomerase-like protein (cupin superfamily)